MKIVEEKGFKIEDRTSILFVFPLVSKEIVKMLDKNMEINSLIHVLFYRLNNEKHFKIYVIFYVYRRKLMCKDQIDTNQE